MRSSFALNAEHILELLGPDGILAKIAKMILRGEEIAHRLEFPNAGCCRAEELSHCLLVADLDSKRQNILMTVGWAQR